MRRFALPAAREVLAGESATSLFMQANKPENGKLIYNDILGKRNHKNNISNDNGVII